VVGVFAQAEELLAALEQVRTTQFRAIETFSPIKLEQADRILGRGASPVRYWTLVGAILGLSGGFTLAIGAALVNGLIVGGKHPVSIIPYCVVGFEGTILIGSLVNLAGLWYHCRLGRRLRFGYDPRFSRDKFGLLLACEVGEVEEARRLLASLGPEEVYVVG
jgi:molybdopterin-containing oxidoreductase family membrane subunit